MNAGHDELMSGAAPGHRRWWHRFAADPMAAGPLQHRAAARRSDRRRPGEAS